MRKETLKALENVLGVHPGWAVIHSSLAKLAPSKPIDKWDILFAVKELTNRGWTLAFPAFTFSYIPL